MNDIRIAGDDAEIAESVRANYVAAIEPGYFRAGRIIGATVVWIAVALLAVALVSGVVLVARLLRGLL